MNLRELARVAGQATTELTNLLPHTPTLRDPILANLRVPASASQMPMRWTLSYRVFGQSARHGELVAFTAR